MLLTKSQQHRFWREWSVACKVQGWDKAHSWTGLQIDNERRSLLDRAGFTSLTLVDHTTGFDRVLSELAALSKPASLAPQLRALDQPRIRLIWSIRHSEQKYGLSTNYWQTIAIDRFGSADLDTLTTHQLEQLRNTLASRAVAEHTREKSFNEAIKRRAKKEQTTEPPRIQFPDVPSPSFPCPHSLASDPVPVLATHEYDNEPF